jgi:hypothetical protein
MLSHVGRFPFSRTTDLMIMKTVTRYCYHCGKTHPEDEMRQVKTGAGMRWRCIKSIQAVKKTAAERDAFGKQVTAINSKQQSAMSKSQTSQTFL